MANDPTPRPFTIEHRQKVEKDAHHFAPDARVSIHQTLRTSGMLKALPEALTRTLLALLTFLTPNGRVEVTASNVAEALGIPENEAKERLLSLQAVTWVGKPLLYSWQETDSLGTSRFTLSPHVYEVETPDFRNQESSGPPIPVRPNWRAEVYSQSRERYGRPRAEVEEIIREQLGHTDQPDDSSPDGKLTRRLMAYGITVSEAQRLVSTCPAERIERQISWMAHRQAKSPARFLTAAIERDFDPPLFVQLSQQRSAREASSSDAG